MAESFDDGEFWLPPQFLSDDDVLVSRSAATQRNRDGFRFQADAGPRKGGFSSFGGFGAFGGNSHLTSPPTETESADEDLVAGLTRQMDRSIIGDDFGWSQPSFASDNTNGRTLTGSPQSTLCAVGSGCLSRHVSNGGRPNGLRQMSSTPATWDLLNAAAVEVARMKMNKEDLLGFNKRNMGPPTKPSPVKTTHPSLYHQRLQAAKFHLLKQQQQLQQRAGSGHQVVQSRARNSELIGSRLPPQQQQQNNVSAGGMRAIFLGPKRESAGTGVFLPLRKGGVGGGASDKRKKPGCPVLLPARVVQALNLNLDEMGPQAQVLPRFHDVPVRLSVEPPQRRGNNNVQSQPGMKHEVRLPQEWIY